jgi:hypothetical protein
MKYLCEGLGAIEAANIKHAARIFANRVAHERYGPKGRCRMLRLLTHKGADGASFEAFVGIPPLYGHDVSKSYRFEVIVVRETEVAAAVAQTNNDPDQRGGVPIPRSADKEL